MTPLAFDAHAEREHEDRAQAAEETDQRRDVEQARQSPQRERNRAHREQRDADGFYRRRDLDRGDRVDLLEERDPPRRRRRERRQRPRLEIRRQELVVPPT